jgi:hypothetical protein
VDPSNASNGCIELVEGSHNMNVPISKDNCIVPAWVGAQKWVPVEMKAGNSLKSSKQNMKFSNRLITDFDSATNELLIFGSALAHRSGPNYSTQDRRTVYATYNPKIEGDLHDAYYGKRAKLWPATHKRKDGVNYSEGVQDYAYGTPMRTIETLGVDS